MGRPKPANLLASLFLCSSLFHALLPSTTLAQLFPIVFSNHTQVFIVHVQDPETPAHLLSAKERDQWYLSYLPNTTLDSGEPRMVFTYAFVISGFAARLTAEEAEALEFRDGFILAHPEQNQPLHTTYTYEMLGLNRFNGPWEHSNQGEGVIIAVVDTGIRADHPSFADTHTLPPPPLKWRGRCDLPPGSGNCNNKLIGAQNFIESTPPETPIDDWGHGMHVAGIAAGSLVKNVDLNGLASGTAAGMAPRAYLAAYKVCNKMKKCPDGASLKGIEQAILDGVDILQMSYGGPAPLHKDSNAKGSFRALERGILTVCSAQNSGPMPGIISNDAPWILTVGATTTGRRNTVVLKLGNGMEFTGVSSSRPDPSGIVNVPLIYPVDQGQGGLACNSIPFPENITGKIVICDRTDQSELLGQSWVVRKNGGAGIIMLNRIRDGDTLPSIPYNIPGLLVTHNDALKIVSYLSTETNPTATIASTGTEFGVRPSPSVAAFSSRGPSTNNGGILKPDVVAPGVDILSAWPLDPNTRLDKSDAFEFQPGTSMAAPHVSGIAALLKNVHPDWSPAMIKSAIMTTTYTEDRDKNRITDDGSNDRSPANAFALGAGHVNPSAAEDPGLVYDTPVDDYIPYLCGLRGMTVKQVIAITKKPVACHDKMEAEQLNYPSIQVSMGAGAPNIKTIYRTVKNVGNAISIYDAAIVQPEGLEVDVKPRTLKFFSIGEEQTFAVEIRLTGSPPAGLKDVREGRLTWTSGDYRVASPIVITQ